MPEKIVDWGTSGIIAGAIIGALLALPIDRATVLQLSIPIAFVAARWGLCRRRRPVPESFWKPDQDA